MVFVIWTFLIAFEFVNCISFDADFTLYLYIFNELIAVVYLENLTKFGVLFQLLTMLEILALFSHYQLQQVMKKCFTAINVLIT